jgi:ribosome biogenesis protein MAK21
MLVNKLGDPDRKVASKVVFVLSELITKHHPMMKPAVVQEIEQLLFRPKVQDRAQYFAVIFLNQILFTKE